MAQPSPAVRFARYGALAFEFSGTIAGGVFFGWLIDRWLGVEPYGLVAGTLLAVAGGFVQMIRLLRRFDRLDRDPEP